ncbi:MAG: autotransporter-associated beta strand repeat-containing protein [Planctomycetaceae bacterium]
MPAPFPSRSLPALVPVLWLAVAAAPSAAAPPSTTYKLVFADEFNGSGLDTVKWIDAYPWGRTHNHDAYMASSNVLFPGDGTVTLKAERVAQGGKTFTSGVISTGYTIEKWDGGYFEARILLPTTPGSWPAFWGLDSGWPPEADIMEFPLTTDGGANGYPNTDYHTAWHYKNTSGGNSAGAGRVNPSSASALNTGWHTFGMEWTSDVSAKFFFDGVQVSSFSDATAISQMTSMYLILNYAVGGWPGTPSLTQWPAAASDQTKVDWVRVWQKPTVTGTVSLSGTAAGGSWDTAARWSGGVPRFEDQIVALGSNTNSALTLDWNQARTVGGLAFSSTTTSYTVGDAGASLQLARSSGTPTISLAAVNARPQAIASRIELYEATTAIANDSAQTLSLTGTIVGEGALTVDGTGTVVFANNNTYTGDTTIDSGAAGPAVARVTRSRPFGTGTVTLGATGNATTARIEIQDTRSVPNTIRFAGRTNATVGLLNIGGTNDFQGTIVAVAGGTSYVIQSDAGLMRLTGTAADAGGVALTSAATGSRTFTLQGAGRGEIAGGITNGSGTVHLLKAGAGTWSITGSTAHTGTTTIQAGTLRLATATALAASPTVVAGGTLAIDSGLTPRMPRLLLAGGTVQAASVLVNAAAGIGRLEVQAGGFASRPLMSVSGGGVVELQGAGGDLQVGTLVVDQATGGRLDVGRARLSVAAGGISQAALLADLVAGLGSGGWDGGVGITSGAAAAAIAAGKSRTLGWIDSGAGAFTVAFAAPGDTDLDGLIDILDAANLLGGGRYDTGSAATWSNGDFNYDGVVDVLDASDFIASGLYDAGGYLAAGAAEPIAAVPEPSTAGGLAAVVLAVSRALCRRSAPRRPPADSIRPPRRPRRSPPGSPST